MAMPKVLGRRAANDAMKSWTAWRTLGRACPQVRKNVWVWFKDSWDEAMLSEHGAEWGCVFAEYIQGVLERLDKGTTDAFSRFVHDESKRVLGMTPALRVP